MLQRGFIVLLALAAMLLTAGCAPRQVVPRVDRTERRLDIDARFTLHEFRLDRIEIALCNLEDEVRSGKETGSDTAMTDPDPDLEGVADQLDTVCQELEAAIAAILLEIARLEAALESARTQIDAMKDNAKALAMYSGLAEDLEDIDDKVKSVKEGGGDPLVMPASCADAVADLADLQLKLTTLERKVKELLDQIARATGSTAYPW